MSEKPELSDGHGRIANEIMDALARTHMSSYESQFIWCLFRKTYGWNKKEDFVSISQIAAATGMHLSHVSRTKKMLLDRHIVTQGGNKISFNKYYSQWRELPKGVRSHHKLTKGGNDTPPPPKGVIDPPPPSVITPPPKGAGTKDILTKDSITKASGASAPRATSQDLDFADALFDGMVKINPADATRHSKRPEERDRKVKAWAEDIEKLRRLDGAQPEQIKYMLQWLFSSMKNATFWQKNIRSGGTLRDQWPKLVLACKEDVRQKQGGLTMPDFRSQPSL